MLPCQALSCGCHRLPTGLEDVSKYPALVAELLARNWTEQEVSAALAKNLLRVFKKVEEVSGACGSTGGHGNGWGKGIRAGHGDVEGTGVHWNLDKWVMRMHGENGQ